MRCDSMRYIYIHIYGDCVNVNVLLVFLTYFLLSTFVVVRYSFFSSSESERIRIFNIRIASVFTVNIAASLNARATQNEREWYFTVVVVVEHMKTSST